MIVGRIVGRMARHDEVMSIISQIALRSEHYPCYWNDNQNEQLLFAWPPLSDWST